MLIEEVAASEISPCTTIMAMAHAACAYACACTISRLLYSLLFHFSNARYGDNLLCNNVRRKLVCHAVCNSMCV